MFDIDNYSSYGHLNQSAKIASRSFHSGTISFPSCSDYHYDPKIGKNNRVSMDAFSDVLEQNITKHSLNIF